MSSVQSQGQQLLEKLKNLEKNAETGNTLASRNGITPADAATFPAIYGESDPRDDMLEIKNRIATSERPAPISDWEVESILGKRAQFEVAKEEEWFQNAFSFDASNPVQQRWAQQVFPEYFQRREQIIDQQAELQKAIAKLKLRGAHTREELDLVYGLSSGRVKLPDKPLWQLTGTPMDNDAVKRGIWNPRRNAITESRGWTNARGTPFITKALEGQGKQPQGYQLDMRDRTNFGYE